MSDYLDAVAGHALVPVPTAAKIIADHGIVEYLPARPAAQLRIDRVRFSGFKDLRSDPTADPFSFEMTVPEGVSALASAGNSAGKTSVVEIIRWLLTGRSAVDNWVFKRIRRARLDFRLDGQPFTVQTTLDDGALAGRLSQRGEVLRTFDQGSFETVMEGLLLPRLGLDRISVFQRPAGSTRGKATEAGWALLSDGLHVRPSELSSVIGGVPVRAAQMLQVYLALPWYDTLLQARAALGVVRQNNRDAEQATRAEHQVRAHQTERIQQELQQARLELAAMSDAQELADRLRTAVDRAAELAREQLTAAARVTAATQELADAKDTQIIAQRALHTIVEREAAGAFFRALEPKACPRCTKPIDEQRRAHETDDHVCSVCDRPAVYEPDVMARERAEEQVAATTEAVECAEETLAQVTREHKEIADRRTAAERQVASLAGSGALEQRRAREARVHRLEGRVEEREETSRILTAGMSGADDVTRVLEAAEAEANARVRASADLFAELNTEILSLGQRFGISGLTHVKLNRAARLPVTKEGTDYNFGELPDGDKLRLKVAVVIALLRIGHRRGAGRHPGLLFVDSPGAEEVAAGSLREMISGLVEVAAELGLQVVTATARLDDVQSILEPHRLRTPAKGRTTLW